MARGTIIVVALLLGLGVLINRSCQKTIRNVEQHLGDLATPGDLILRSGVVMADDALPPPVARPAGRYRLTWRVPVL